MRPHHIRFALALIYPAYACPIVFMCSMSCKWTERCVCSVLRTETRKKTANFWRGKTKKKINKQQTNSNRQASVSPFFLHFVGVYCILISVQLKTSSVMTFVQCRLLLIPSFYRSPLISIFLKKYFFIIFYYRYLCLWFHGLHPYCCFHYRCT